MSSSTSFWTKVQTFFGKVESFGAVAVSELKVVLGWTAAELPTLEAGLNIMAAVVGAAFPQAAALESVLMAIEDGVKFAEGLVKQFNGPVSLTNPALLPAQIPTSIGGGLVPLALTGPEKQAVMLAQVVNAGITAPANVINILAELSVAKVNAAKAAPAPTPVPAK